MRASRSALLAPEPLLFWARTSGAWAGLSPVIAALVAAGLSDTAPPFLAWAAVSMAMAAVPVISANFPIFITISPLLIRAISRATALAGGRYRTMTVT